MTLKQFKAWLLSRGATIEPSTSEWELVRYRRAGDLPLIQKLQLRKISQ